MGLPAGKACAGGEKGSWLHRHRRLARLHPGSRRRLCSPLRRPQAKLSPWGQGTVSMEDPARRSPPSSPFPLAPEGGRRPDLLTEPCREGEVKPRPGDAGRRRARGACRSPPRADGQCRAVPGQAVPCRAVLARPLGADRCIAALLSRSQHRRRGSPGTGGAAGQGSPPQGLEMPALQKRSGGAWDSDRLLRGLMGSFPTQCPASLPGLDLLHPAGTGREVEPCSGSGSLLLLRAAGPTPGSSLPPGSLETTPAPGPLFQGLGIHLLSLTRPTTD